MKNFLHLSLAASTLLAATIDAQAATFIDTFEQGIIDLSVSPIDLVDTGSASHTSILGGTREIELLLTATDDQAFATTNLFASSDNFSHSNNTGASSIASITYDAGGNGLGANLLGLGNSFAIDVTDIDLATQFEIFVVDSNNRESSSLSESITKSQRVLFDFDSFTGVNLSSIDEIHLVSQGGLNVDVEIDSFSIVGQGIINVPQDQNRIPIDATNIPEPATIMGLFFCCGLGIFSRKKIHFKENI
ncbi:exported hypothetical protein [Hyella patelloides LEGE 07179]|uniref:PEP-CTERM protein-sorting domain-containing protein n=1 Tax=Hyella patelloides LEGE 07179 TaxID=945734 RepID=A0A563VYQ6_9CYAN|nr:PEP-CTERM sorting domain-containing protein [Hyella patelloides]VEP16588.1 exported hypothetical protein [Hyella patelloides LEGE 07179]